MTDNPTQPDVQTREEYCYFVSGHAFVKDPTQPIGTDAQPININTIIRLEDAITDDAGIDRLTEIARQHLAAEAESMSLILIDYPTIRQVNLLHTLVLHDATGTLVEVR